MSLADNEYYKLYKKHEQTVMAIEALLIIILFSTTIYLFTKDIALKKEINQFCGYGEEDYYCYCEKSQASEIKNKLQDDGIDLTINFGEENVSLDG